MCSPLQDDVRRTHRYIARVLHDNPQLKLSAFGIGNEPALPPTTHTELDVPAWPARPAPLAVTASASIAPSSSLPPTPNGVGPSGPGLATPAVVFGSVATPMPSALSSDTPAVKSDADAACLATPAPQQSGFLVAELESLRQAYDEASATSDARLKELTDLYAQLTATKQELERAKYQVRVVCSANCAGLVFIDAGLVRWSALLYCVLH